MNPMRAFQPATIAAGATLLVMLAIPVEPAKRADGPAGGSNARNAPAPPRRFVDTTFPVLAGRTIHVPAGGDLQKALDAAHAGDLITLEPKAVYQGPFRLPATKGVGWIVVSTALPQPGLPAQGQRVNPSHAAVMPKLIASSGPVIQARRDAHHFRFVGLEIAPADGVFLYALVELGNEDTEMDALPHDIVFDRCYLHGDPVRGTRRGIAMNSRDTAVIDSHLSDFKEQGADSQAIAGWNGAGPFKIVNNYLEAAGENIMFGGADPTIRDLVPADIEIRHNHLAKPLRWKVGHDTFEGVEWSVKNLFELKNARRVLIDGNLFEYNWPHAQNGFAILFTVRNQDGRAPWSTVEDVVFRNNVVRHVGAGINVLGRDDNHPSQQVKRLDIRNNLFLDVGGRWGSGRLFQLLDGTSDVVIDHNTALQTGGLLFGGDGAGHTGFVFQNNIAPDRRRGISGSGVAVGLPALNRYFPAALIRRNVLVGGLAGEYPSDNFFAASLEDVGFVSQAENRMRLSRASPYARAATDGRDPGSDLDAADSSVERGLRSLSGSVRGPGTGRGGETNTSGGAPEVLFWLSFALLAYVYAGYPLVAALTAALHSRPHRRAPIEPSVSVVVVAYNECTRLRARIENLLALDYPKERLEIVIGSDGSTDDTVECAQAYANRGVTVRPFGERRGKPSLLNVLVPAAHGDIVVLADVRQRFDPAAVRALVANFADPTVGAASGELMLTAERATGTAGQGSASYWRYEKLIRAMESRVDSTIGATGAIYAIRRDLFETIPQDTILDDVLIPLRIARRGYRVVFEPAARAYDQVSTSTRQEFARRTRTIGGTFQLFVRERWLFNPLANRLWLQTVSHKALRLTLPLLHVALLVANVALVHVEPYRWLLAAQLAFYAAALFGCARRRAGRRPIFVSVPHAICLLSWATIVGFVRMVTHRQPVTWEHVSPPGVVSS
jgi:glycosyltransferase involved in cell wall biosynthesis